MSDDGLKRLHISPLSPELLNVILHPSIRSSATDISFHAIPTFPENNYGFFTLPTMEADKITKKLNGSILKGKKLKIQEARPKKKSTTSESTLAVDADKAEKAAPPSTTARSSRKRKSSEDTVPGFELPASRKVKRGWTEEPAKDKKTRKESKTDKDLDKKKRKSQRSQYTDRPECLFRTVPPPNKDAADEKQKKKRKPGKLASDGVVVHEFKHTVPQPTFLKESESTSEIGMTSEYVDGVGWVDRSGNVKEPAVSKPTKKQSVRQLRESVPKETQAKATAPTTVSQGSVVAVDSDETSSSGSSTESSSSDSSTEDDDDESVSSAASVNVSGNASEEEMPSPVSKEMGRKPERAVEKRAPSTPEMGSLPANVHPLEALFKRPAVSSSDGPKRPPEINTQFSFFGKEDDESSENYDDSSANALHHVREPHTPFTKLDLQKRGLRSGAPTPDTAAINRSMTWPRDFDADEDEEEEEYGDDVDKEEEDKEEATIARPALKSKPESKDESDFSKWFWENRGDNNRAWKRRRREAAKEKRQRDNRKRGLRGK
jgi:hypothetical protein